MKRILQTPLPFENRIVPVLILLTTLYAATRLEKIFRTVPEGVHVFHNYDLEKYLTDYPGGLLGMIPTIVCATADKCAKVDPRVVGVLDDAMLSTGFVVAFFGLWLSLWLDPLYRAMRDQLLRDGVVGWTPQDDRLVEERRRVWSRATAMVVGVLMVIGFLGFHFGGLPKNPEAWEFFLGSCLLGVLAGHRLGASAAYGTVGPRINRRDRLALVVGHADGAGGARRVGEFLAFQGVLISIPIIWLTFWLTLVVQVTPFYAHFGTWWPLHVALLAVALIISWLGFIRPLLIFTRHYRAAKTRLLDDWQSKTSGMLARLQDSYFGAKDWQAARDAIDAAEDITLISSKIAALNSVPLRASVRGVFSIATIFPVATLVIELMVPQHSALAQVLAQGVGFIEWLLG